MYTRNAIALAAALLSTLACTRFHEPAAAASAGPPPEKVVAEVDGRKITREELEGRAASRLQRLRQEEYQVLRETLEDMVQEGLVEKEAAARGISKEALLEAEVEGKLKPISAAEVDSAYEQYKPRLGGQTKEQVTPQIQQMLRQRRRTDRSEAFHRELKGRATVRIALEPPRAPVAVPADAPILGPREAPVTIVEFTDYQCPFCHRAQQTVEQLLSLYAGKVRLVSRDFPLDIHPRAKAASRAARCAGEQSRFWEYHRDLLKTPTDYSDEDLKRRAAGLGIGAAAFSACLQSDRHDGAIQKSLDEGTRLGVTGTPTFFINGVALFGAKPIQEFQQVIDQELAGKR